MSRRLFHDSRDAIYRRPYGAVPCGSAVALSFQAMRQQAPVNVRLRIWSTSRGEQVLEPVRLAPVDGIAERLAYEFELEISKLKIEERPIELRSSVWEEEKYNVIHNISNEMLREFDYIYMAIDLINGKTVTEIEDEFIVKIDINELKNGIEKIIDRVSIEVGMNEKQLGEMIRKFQIKQ